MEIPGYYFDPDKNRYFRIQNGSSSSSNVWTASRVKRQKLLDAKAEAAKQREEIVSKRIKRSKWLQRSPSMDNFARECGHIEADAPSVAYAQGLRAKGGFVLANMMYNDEDTNELSALYIDHYLCTSGKYVAYGIIEENRVVSTYLDRNDDVDWDDCTAMVGWNMDNEFSSISFHRQTGRMLFTSRMPYKSRLNAGPVVTATISRSPPTRPADGSRLEPFSVVPTSASRPHEFRFETLSSAAAPANASLMFAMGTDRGIMQWRAGADAVEWLAPMGHPHAGHACIPYPLYRDILGVSFTGDGSTIRFGSRAGALFTADPRIDCTAWTYSKVPSAITHVRCLSGGNQVLVSGLKNHMAIYDIRNIRTHRPAEYEPCTVDMTYQPSANKPPVVRPFDQMGRDIPTKHKKARDLNASSFDEAKPVTVFEKYRNSAHIVIGLDLDESTGVVAAAHDEPDIVALYSLRTGAQLRVLDMRNQTRRRRPEPSVKKAIQFQTFHGEKTPSLLIGSGHSGHVVEFRMQEREEGIWDECGEFVAAGFVSYDPPAPDYQNMPIVW